MALTNEELQDILAGLSEEELMHREITIDTKGEFPTRI